MDGEINVESEVKKGTKFLIYVILAVNKDEDQNYKRSTKLNKTALNLQFGMKNLNSSMAALKSNLLAQTSILIG